MRLRRAIPIAVGIVTTLTLAGTTASFAYFNSAATAAGTARAGNIAVTQTVSPSLVVAAPFKSTNQSVTGSVTVTNTGSVGGNFTTSVPSVDPGSNAALGSAIAVWAWPNSAGTDCATQARPGNAVRTSGQPLFSGTIAAGATIQYCVQATLDVYNDVSGIASGSASRPNIASTLTAGTQWSANAGPQMTELRFIDDIAPSTPGNFTASGISSSGLTLNWSASTDNVGVAGYRLSRNGTTFTPGPTGTSYGDSGLAPNTRYDYTVTALDAAGNVSGPATVSAWTAPAANVAYTVKQNDMCVDAGGKGYPTGTLFPDGYTLVAKSCIGSSSQKWTLQTDGSRFKVVGTSGRLWDVAGASTQAGDPVLNWPSNGGLNQRWQMNPVGDGTVQFVNVNSNLCLQMPTTNGAQLTQQTCNTSLASQKFTLQ